MKDTIKAQEGYKVYVANDGDRYYVVLDGDEDFLSRVEVID